MSVIYNEFKRASAAAEIDLNADDMLRASSITALESVREALAPREIDSQYLRGVFASEADAAPFMAADAAKAITPPALVAMLEECGLVVRNPVNRRLQFAYDPVAELLAAWRLVHSTREPGIRQTIERVREVQDSGLATALKMAEAA